MHSCCIKPRDSDLCEESTGRRGKTEAEDKMLEQLLLKDEKQCAEHIMLVDLGRNDVGKVSKPGTVKVEKLMNVEKFSHVQHISSPHITQASAGILDQLTGGRLVMGWGLC